VEIRGENLGTSQSDLLEVKILDQTCRSINWLSKERIACKTPRSGPSTSGPVSVINKSGGTSNQDIIFTYNPGL